jgi:hypothetical protein
MQTTKDQTVAAGPSIDPTRWQQTLDELLGRIAGHFARVERGCDYGADRSATLLALASHAPKIGADAPPLVRITRRAKRTA